jgi:integral membrane protein (TIGR01906 family)
MDREFSTAWFYNYGFQKYRVDQTTGFSEEELSKIADEFVGYFNSSEPKINSSVEGWDSSPLFDEWETIHFQDVKNLVVLDRRIMLGSLGVILLGIIWWQRRDWSALGRSLLTGGILTAVLLLLAVVGVTLNFDWLFLQFHLFSFSNNFWYSNGYMTTLFPQDFWYDMAMFTVLITTALAAVFGAAGYALMRFTGKKNKK